MGRSRIVPDRCGRIVSPFPARGEIWWCELPEVGRRPVVVLSRDAAIPRLRRTLVGPCTTTIRGLPSEVVLEPNTDPVPRRSAVNLDSIESVWSARLHIASADSPMTECVRSAAQSRSRSPAEPRRYQWRRRESNPRRIAARRQSCHLPGRDGALEYRAVLRPRVFECRGHDHARSGAALDEARNLAVMVRTDASDIVVNDA